MILNSTVQGASHVLSSRECQDFSLVWEDPSDHIRIAAVSDGHGSERHFRSAIGSKTACEVAVDVLRQMAVDVDYRNIDNSGIKEQVARCICSRWTEKILEDIAAKSGYAGIEVYGCTLVAYLQTPKFWFALQIGDGRCVILNRRNYFRQPIEWDERCVCGFTTSMCDKNAASEFRFACGKRRSIPKAVFLCSDGVDGTFGERGNLYVFYHNILRSLRKDGFVNVVRDLPTALSHFSEVGSKDDMSLAVVVNSL